MPLSAVLAHACSNLYETELSLLVDPDYMENHGPDYQPKMYIDQSMRMIVISWLVEVACEYELHQETLFLAAALLDRFMSVAKVRNAFFVYSTCSRTYSAYVMWLLCRCNKQFLCAVANCLLEVHIVNSSQFQITSHMRKKLQASQIFWCQTTSRYSSLRLSIRLL